MSRETHKTRLIAFLETICRPGARVDPADEATGLIAAGLIDSLAMLEIIGFLEREYGIGFQDPDVDPNDVSSVARILDLIERKAS